MKKALSVIWASAILFLALPAYAHDVKDPVCRMTVDTDTTPFKHRAGGKSFYFCSKDCQTTFAKTPAKYTKLAQVLETSEGKQYAVDVKTQAPAEAGVPAELAFSVRYADSKQLVKEFEYTHEKLMHLIIMSEDMSYFVHEHPLRGEDGVFRLTWSFPQGGRYRLYTDFTPSDGDNQIKLVPIVVKGETPPGEKLVPDRVLTRQVGDYSVSLSVKPEGFTVEKQALLSYTIRDKDGKPVTDMEPYIGAMGHLFAVSEDGKEVVHTHAVHASSAPSHGSGGEAELSVTPELATEKGPTFSFKVTIPTSGLYRVWGEFMHRGKVINAPFTFMVKDPWAESGAGSAARAQTVRATGASKVPTSKANKSAQKNVQRVTVQIDGGYSPAAVKVKAGRPVELTLVRREKFGCGETVVFPSLGIKRTLKNGGKTVVSFTPKKAGAIAFTCGMNMYKGQVVAQ